MKKRAIRPSAASTIRRDRRHRRGMHAASRPQAARLARGHTDARQVGRQGSQRTIPIRLDRFDWIITNKQTTQNNKSVASSSASRLWGVSDTSERERAEPQERQEKAFTRRRQLPQLAGQQTKAAALCLKLPNHSITTSLYMYTGRPAERGERERREAASIEAIGIGQIDTRASQRSHSEGGAALDWIGLNCGVRRPFHPLQFRYVVCVSVCMQGCECVYHAPAVAAFPCLPSPALDRSIDRYRSSRSMSRSMPCGRWPAWCDTPLPDPPPPSLSLPQPAAAASSSKKP